MASQQIITALEVLHKELEKLEPAIRHIESAQLVTEIVKEIPQKHIDLLQSLKAEDLKLKEALKNLFNDELTSIILENKKLTVTTTDIQKDVKNELVAVGNVNNTVKNFHERVEKIQFPERLDKIDANIAGIMAAVQGIQGRLDLVERNISEKIKSMADSQILYNSMLDKQISDQAKKQFYQNLVTWILIIGGGILLVLMVKLNLLK